MPALADTLAVLRRPASALAERLLDPVSARTLFITTVTPFAAIRPIAVLVRSLLVGTPMPGFVIGIGSFALQVGTWLGLALVLPTLARQFRATMTERQGFVLATYALSPLWLAGALYALPEDPSFIFVWSRILVALLAFYGLYIVHRGFVALHVRRSMRVPLLAATAVASLTLYTVLFTLLGIGATVVLFVIG